MSVFHVLKGAVCALFLTVGFASATVMPSPATTVDFEIGASTSAGITNQSCWGRCGISAALSDGVVGSSFSLAVGESYTFDFIDFTVRGFGLGTFDVAANLGFSAPGGDAGFVGGGVFATLFGVVSGGSLNWDSVVETVTLANGTIFSVALEAGKVFGLGNSANASATVTLIDAPAPVPLPASALLLIAGVGGLAAIRRRQAKAMAA